MTSLFTDAARQSSSHLPCNHSVDTNDDTDDDYFAFGDSAENTHQQQQESTSSNTSAMMATGSGYSKCDLEVLQYLDDLKRDLHMLNSYPIIKNLFLKYNSVLSSSAPVERLFSFAGMISWPHRMRMADQTFKRLRLFMAHCCCRSL